MQKGIDTRDHYLKEELVKITQKVDSGFQNITRTIPKHNSESWTSWSKRLSVGAWKWCTRQK